MNRESAEGGGPSRRGGPGWAAALHRLAWRAVGGEEGVQGRGTTRLNVVINVHKAATGAFVLGLMLLLDVFTAAAWTYVALHGSYGVAWVIKDVTVGDRKWRRRVGPGGVLGTWAFLSLYWVAPVLLILGTAGVLDLGGWAPAGVPGLAVATALYAIGLVLMIGADVQKNTALGRHESGTAAEALETPSPGPGLVTGGFFARTRHPNYLGEMMIYGSFALVVGHWLPWAILAAVWALFFLPNMLAIEARLSRYPAYGEWRERTGFLLPRLTRGGGGPGGV